MISTSWSQIPMDSAITLQGVDIVSIRELAANAGSKTQRLDSTMLDRTSGGNLADLLALESPIFIKSYGLGSLATSSFRGGSAAHTAVLWNGVPINSPTNGQVDFSLIPINYFDNSRIVYGGGSSIWGSGAIGGSIHLERNAQFDKSLELNVAGQVGSFQQFRNDVNMSYGANKYAGYAGISYGSAQNNFPIISGEKESKLQEHSSVEQLSIYTDHHFKLGARNTISFHQWNIFNERQIPPTILESGAQATQKDAASRSLISWRKVGNKTIWESRMAYFNDGVEYLDPRSAIESKTEFESFIVQSELKYRIHQNHSILFGLSEVFSSVKGGNFSFNTRQNQAAIFASHLFTSKNERIQTNLSIRQELLDEFLVPLVYSGGLNWRAFDWISFRSKASKDYRIPTLNDRFWQPGGNPDLKSESGFSHELGSDIDFSNRTLNFSFAPTIFNRWINNWIIWLPSQGNWSPQNILQVWSRGLETNTTFGYQQGPWNVNASFTTNYVVTTSQKAISENDQSVNKQLIYVPMYSGIGRLTIRYHRLNVSWIQNYTGYRYTASDHSDYLTPYWMSSIYTSWEINKARMKTHLFTRVNNLFNEDYQLIQDRPMPGRNFLFGIDITLHQKTKHA